MGTTGYSGQHRAVAPLAGSVDRNLISKHIVIRFVTVAPLAGSVDRNIYHELTEIAALVAPLAGSVDRNFSSSVYRVPPRGRSPRGERG